MPGITGGNSRDLFGGAAARLQIGKWVTAGGAATLIDCGWLRQPEIDLGRDSKLVEVDNATWAIDAYFTKSTATVKAHMVEAALRKIAMAMGDDPTAATGDVTVASGSATYALDEPTTMQFWQCVITVIGRSMAPAYAEYPNDVYTKRVYTLYRGFMKTKITQSFKVKDETVIPVELDFLLDTSITYSKGTIGRIGKIVDSTT